MKRIFIHGLDSSNKGRKAAYFRELFPDMLIPHFVGSLEQRMEQLNKLLSGHKDIVIVGSSFGGLMAAIYALDREATLSRIILLAPALNFLEFGAHDESRVSVPVHIYQGRHDTITPLSEVEAVARRIFTNLTFHALDDGHLLRKNFKKINWSSLLA